MSIEQMIVLALVILLPLLEAVARVRRMRPAQNDASGHAVAQPPPALPRPLAKRNVSRVVQAAQKAVVPVTPRPAPLPRSAPDNSPSPAVCNLRRAIVAATILGPPPQ